jgi:hypothetical protein
MFLEICTEHLLHELETENLLAQVLYFVCLIRFEIVMDKLGAGVNLRALFFVPWIDNQ